jgi:hypothetical protein
MYQSLNLCNLSDEEKYKILCKLYSRFKSAIKIATENAYKKPIADAKVNELDSILEDIESFPIAWSFYVKQEFKFTPDFENLVIFKDSRKYLDI